MSKIPWLTSVFLALFASQGVHASVATPSDAELLGLLSRADIVFIGRIVKVGDCPQAYSGFATAYQVVRYEVLSVLKGRITEPTVAVGHVIAWGPYVEESVSCLRAAFFRQDARALVFGKRPRRPRVEVDVTSDERGVVFVDIDELAVAISTTLSSCKAPDGFATAGHTRASRLVDDPHHPELEFVNPEGERRVIGREILQQFIGDCEYDILSMELSPDETRVAVELFDLDVRT